MWRASVEHVWEPVSPLNTSLWFAFHHPIERIWTDRFWSGGMLGDSRPQSYPKCPNKWVESELIEISLNDGSFYPIFSKDESFSFQNIQGSGTPPPSRRNKNRPSYCMHHNNHPASRQTSSWQQGFPSILGCSKAGNYDFTIIMILSDQNLGFESQRVGSHAVITH